MRTAARKKAAGILQRIPAETTTRLFVHLTTGDCTVTKGQPLPSQVETTRIARIGFGGRRIVSPPFSNSPTRSNVSPSALYSIDTEGTEP